MHNIKDRQLVAGTEALRVLSGTACCVMVVIVVCSSEIYCAECWSWVLHGIWAKVYGTFIGRYFTAGGQW